MSIKCISLDFWGTVAVYNPAYAKARTQFLSELFGLPEQEAHARYQFLKRSYDNNAEKTGEAVTPLQAIKSLLSDQNINAVIVLESFEQMVRDHPPILHPDLRQAMIDLQSRDIIVGVSSNTNFIAGSLLQDIFQLPWNFAVYSDEIGLSKPDPDFFRMVIKKSGCASSEIIHIGDNTVCDVHGASEMGIGSKYTSGPEETIQLLNRFL